MNKKPIDIEATCLFSHFSENKTNVQKNVSKERAVNCCKIYGNKRVEKSGTTYKFTVSSNVLSAGDFYSETLCFRFLASEKLQVFTK